MNIVGVVLAGGRSSRMGTDKAMLPLGKLTLLERNFQLITDVVGEPCWVSGSYPSFPCITDTLPNCGPLGGMTSCMAQLEDKCDGVLFLPVDMPNIRHEVLSQLCDLFKATPQDYYFSPSLFPMLLSTQVGHASRLAKALANREFAVRRYLLSSGAQMVNASSDNDSYFINTNTPAQWQQSLQTK